MSEATTKIEISRIESETVIVPLIGTAPLIMNRFSEKAKRQMIDAQTGRRSPKQNRDPEAEYQAALYRLKDGRFGFPTVGFKHATISAARFYGKNVRMSELKQVLFMHGETSEEEPQALVPITGEPRMREDVIRLAGPSASADLRYRPEFPEWSAELTITYVRSSLSRDSLLSLIDAGGLGGVGEWRPTSKRSIAGGTFGTYRIDPSRDVEVLP